MEVTIGRDSFVKVDDDRPFRPLVSPDGFLWMTLFFLAIGFTFTSSFVVSLVGQKKRKTSVVQQFFFTSLPAAAFLSIGVTFLAMTAGIYV